MNCDYDPPEFSDTAWPKARKIHICCECGYAIPKGEKYERVSGKWDGEMNVFKTCERCADLRDSLAEYNCGCYLFGGLSEDYWEYLQELYNEVSDAQSIHDRVFDKHQNWGEQA